MVLGNIAMQELGINLRGPRKALVAHREGLFLPFLSRLSRLFINASTCIGLSTLEKQQQQQQSGQQTRDANARQAKRRQKLEARHEALVKERDEANATKTVEPSNSKSQKGTTGAGNSQQF